MRSASGGSAALAYRVLPPKVMNAANHGVPQKRERVFFVGFRSDLGVEWSFPRETHSREALAFAQRHGDHWDRHRVSRKARVGLGLSTPLGGSLERPGTLAWRTTRDALVGLPDPELNPRSVVPFPDHRFQAGARSYPGHTGR